MFGKSQAHGQRSIQVNHPLPSLGGSTLSSLPGPDPSKPRVHSVIPLSPEARLTGLVAPDPLPFSRSHTSSHPIPSPSPHYPLLLLPFSNDSWEFLVCFNPLRASPDPRRPGAPAWPASPWLPGQLEDCLLPPRPLGRARWLVLVRGMREEGEWGSLWAGAVRSPRGPSVSLSPSSTCRSFQLR